MKTKKRFLALVMGVLLCFSLSTVALADNSSGSFNPSVTFDRTNEENGTFTVIVPEANNAILASKVPTLSVACGYANAKVTSPDGEIAATIADGKISFPVTKGGTYTIKKAFAVTFDSSAPAQIVVYGETASTPTAPSKTGYAFGGWYTDEACTTAYDFTTPITADITLYAKWVADPRTVIFNSKGGSTVTPVTVDYGTAVTAPTAPTRNGYTFDGWYIDSERKTAYDFSTPVTEDITLYAKWTLNQYTVSFEANGGTCDTSSVVVDHGSAIGTLPTPTRGGYWYFNGWYTEASGGSQVTADTVFTEDTTIYAQWYYDEPYYPSVPSVPSTPSTSTETTENEDGSTTTTVTDNKTGTVTETTENVDGSTVTVETKKDGTVTEKVENTDGSTVTTETKPDGSSATTTELADGTTATVTTDVTGETKTEVTVSDKAVETAAETGEAVTLPIPALEAAADRESASVITVITGSEEAVAVQIPVVEVSTSTVAVIVNEDGTETVVTETKMTENGLAIDVPDGATVKIVDNAANFDDVADADWEKDAVNFASARGLVNGVGNNSFDLDGVTTRAHVVTLLARLSGVDTTPDEGETWYDKGHEWAVANGITYAGSMDVAVSRQSMFTMIWRLLGCPKSDHDIGHFTDTDGLTQYTEEAARWAVEIGLIQGNGDGTMNPTGTVTRGQLAQFMMNYIQLT